MPVVYIDMLFLLNLIMDTITLYTASLLTKQSISILRLFAASTLLSVYSCMIFFPQLSLFYTIIGKLLVLILASSVAFPDRNFCKTLKNTLIIFTVSAVFGGIVFAVVFLTNFGTTVGAAISNGEVYLDINASTLLFSATISYIAIYTISYIKQRAENLATLTYNATITLVDKTINIPVFLDTGCSLTDQKGRPAIILSEGASKKLIPKTILSILDSAPGINQLGEYGPRYRILPFSTIGKSSGFLHGFVPDKVILDNKIISLSVIALSPKPISTDSQIEGIFNPILLNTQNELIINNI